MAAERCLPGRLGTEDGPALPRRDHQRDHDDGADHSPLPLRASAAFVGQDTAFGLCFRCVRGPTLCPLPCVLPLSSWAKMPPFLAVP